MGILDELFGGFEFSLDPGQMLKDILNTLINIGEGYASTFGIAILICAIAGIVFKIMWGNKISKQVRPKKEAGLKEEVKGFKKEAKEQTLELTRRKIELRNKFSPKLKALENELDEVNEKIDYVNSARIETFGKNDLMELEGRKAGLKVQLRLIRKEKAEREEEIKNDMDLLTLLKGSLSLKQDDLKELSEKKKREFNWKWFGIYSAIFLAPPIMVGIASFPGFFGGFVRGLIVLVAMTALSGRVAEKFKTEGKKFTFWGKLFLTVIVVLVSVANPLTGLLLVFLLVVIGWIIDKVKKFMP